MCVTCGCSSGAEVRITDPATGKTITLEGSGGEGAHEHTDADGHAYTHSHPLPATDTAGRGDPGSGDRQ